MIQTISPNEDLVFDLVLTDRSGNTIDSSLIANLQFVVFTNETTELQRVYLSGSRYQDGKLYINSDELAQLSSGQMYLTTAIAFLSDSYRDGTFDYIKTSPMPYYLKNNISSVTDDEAVLKWKINVSRDIQDLANGLHELAVQHTADTSFLDASVYDHDIRIQILESMNSNGEVSEETLGVLARSFAKKTDLSVYLTEDDLDPYAKTEDLAPYALKSELPTKTSDLTNDSHFITNDDLLPYAKTEELPVIDLTPYAKKSEIPSLEGYAHTSEVPTKTSDLINDSGFLTQHQSLADYALKSELPDISGKANTADLATVATSGNYNDLTDKPTIPTVDLTKALADSLYQAKGNYIEKGDEFSGSYNDLTDKPTIPTKTSDLTNDSGFLTSHQDLSSYALKSEIPAIVKSTIPDIPVRTSDLANDSGYVTGTDISTNYYTKTEVNSLLQNVDIDTSNFVTKTELEDQVEITVATAVNDLQNNKADKTSIPTKVSDLTNDSGFLTSHQDLTGYATESYVQDYVANNAPAPDMSGYVLESTLQTTLAGYVETSDLEEVESTIGRSLNQLQTEKASIAYVDQKIADISTGSGSSSGSSNVDLSDYVTKTELEDYVTKTELEDQVEITVATAVNDLQNNKADKTSIPTKTSDLTNDSGFITSSSLSGYATESYVQNYVANNASTPDMSGYVTLSAYNSLAQKLRKLEYKHMDFSIQIIGNDSVYANDYDGKFAEYRVTLVNVPTDTDRIVLGTSQSINGTSADELYVNTSVTGSGYAGSVYKSGNYDLAIPVYFNQQEGTVYITASITDPNGTSHTASKTITVNYNSGGDSPIDPGDEDLPPEE